MFDIASILILLVYCIAGYTKGLVKFGVHLCVFILSGIILCVGFCYLDALDGNKISSLIIVVACGVIYFVYRYNYYYKLKSLIEKINIQHKLNNFLGLILGMILGLIIIIFMFVVVVSMQNKHIDANNYKEFIDKAPKNELTIQSGKIVSKPCRVALLYIHKNIVGEEQSNEILKTIRVIKIKKFNAFVIYFALLAFCSL